MRAASSTALVVALMATVVLPSGLSAHRRDKYLQAARLGVEPDHVDLELDLTPGIEVAGAIVADTDRDRDGMLSPDEREAYVGRVLGAIELEVDGKPLHAGPVSSTFPDLDAVRRGEGTIQLRSTVVLPSLADGAHRFEFRNTFQPDDSVYLANALVPRSNRIAVRSQSRDDAQHDLRIDYVVRTGTASSAGGWLLGMIAGAAAWAALVVRPSRAALVVRRARATRG